MCAAVGTAKVSNDLIWRLHHLQSQRGAKGIKRLKQLIPSIQEKAPMTGCSSFTTDICWCSIMRITVIKGFSVTSINWLYATKVQIYMFYVYFVIRNFNEGICKCYTSIKMLISLKINDPCLAWIKLNLSMKLISHLSSKFPTGCSNFSKFKYELR